MQASARKDGKQRLISGGSRSLSDRWAHCTCCCQGTFKPTVALRISILTGCGRVCNLWADCWGLLLTLLGPSKMEKTKH